MTPRISVIIPVYNGAAFIGQAIESVLNQEYPAHEIIVIDDGSTDNTPEVLSRFGNKIIQKRIKNSGPSGARNVGLEMVTGDWIAFLDADDLWFKNKLKKQAEMIIRYPEVGFVCTNFLSYDDVDGEKKAEHFNVIKNFPNIVLDAPLKTDAFLILMRNNFVGTSTVLIKREVVESVGPFNPRYYNSQDFDYWTRASLVTRFLLISDLCVEKRPHEANWSRNKIKAWTCKKMILSDMLERLASVSDGMKRRAYLKACRRSLARLNYRLGSLYFEAGDRGKAFSIYREGLAASADLSNFLSFMNITLKKTARSLVESRS